MLLQANCAVFGHQCNPGPILPHSYVKNIVPAQKLPKLQHFKENSPQLYKESFQNLTFNMKEHFCNLSSRKVGYFPNIMGLYLSNTRGIFKVLLEEYLFISERWGYWYISQWAHRIYIICKRMHRRKSITVQYSASSMLKANLFWDQFGLYIGLDISHNPENDHISAKWPTNPRALYLLELQKIKKTKPFRWIMALFWLVNLKSQKMAISWPNSQKIKNISSLSIKLKKVPFGQKKGQCKIL